MSGLMDTWLQTGLFAAPTPAERASTIWVWINRNASSVVIDRQTGNTSAKLSAQTVRIEGNAASELATESGTAARQSITVFGIIGHPTVANTDIMINDKFSYNAVPATRLNYRVIQVNKTQIGQIQATCEELD